MMLPVWLMSPQIHQKPKLTKIDTTNKHKGKLLKTNFPNFAYTNSTSIFYMTLSSLYHMEAFDETLATYQY
jgi:hypothetical protein